MDGLQLSSLLAQVREWLALPWFALGNTQVNAARLLGLFLIRKSVV